MAENIAVVILFIILVVIGLVFYTNFKRVDAQNEVQVVKIEQAVEVATRVGFLPELQCSKDGIQDSNCVDLFKVQAVDDLGLFTTPTTRNQMYFGILRYSTVTLKSLYPTAGEWLLYNFTPPSITSQEFVPVPIAIYDPLLDRKRVGVLEVTVYG